MKKLLFRVCLIALALIMILGAVACSKDEAEATDTNGSDGVDTVSTETEEEEIKPNFSGNTYDGTTFYVLTRINMDPNIIAVKELTPKSNVLEKAIYERNKTVENQFKVELEFIMGSDSDIRDAVSTNSMADTDTYDLVNMHGRNLMQGVLSNHYLDWNLLPTVNLDAPWWSQGFKEGLATPGGKVFIMNGDISYGYWGGMGGMYFNKDILEAGNVTSPYTYYEQDNWTFETFYRTVREAAASLSAEDGTAGYVNQKFRGAAGAYRMVGYSTLELQSNGKYILGIQNDRVYTAQDEFTTFVFESGACLYEEDLATARKLFQNGAAAFFDDGVSSVAQFAGMNFGFVPWPKYDSNSEHITGVGSGNTSFAIVSNTSETNRARIGDVVEGLAYYGREIITPAYIDTFISYQKFQDHQAAEAFESLRKHVVIDLADYLNPGRVGDIGSLMVSDPTNYPSIVTTIAKLTGDGQMESDLELWYVLDKEN